MTKENEYLLKDTVVEERKQVRDIVCRLCSKLSGLALTCGLQFSLFSLYMPFAPQDPVLSPRFSQCLQEVFFVGGLNILCGLLLLLDED